MTTTAPTPALKIYEIINPSDAVTIAATDEKIAIVTTIVLGEGKYGLRNESGESICPVLMFLSKDQTDETLKKVIGVDAEGLGVMLEERAAEFAECLESALVSSPRTRREFETSVAGMSEGERMKARDAWNDKRRSSINDITKYAYGLAKKLRTMIAEKAATP